MRTNNLLFVFFLSFLLTFVSCTTTPIEITGGASDLEISACVIKGQVVDSLGNAVAGAIVHLRTIDYLSGTPLKDSCIRSHADAFTSQNGMFFLDSIDTGSYSIEINYQDSIGILIPLSIIPHDTLKQFNLVALQRMAIISGLVDVNNNNKDLMAISCVRVYGLERKVKPDSTGHYFVKVPAGNQRMIFSADSQQCKKYEFTVNVIPGEHIDLRVGNIRPPLLCPEGNCDSLAVRTILDFSGLTGIAVDSVTTKEFGRITRLNLSNFSLTKLSPAIEQLQKLKVLDLSHNQLNDSIKSIFLLKNLECLDLKDNNLTSIPRNIENLDFLNNFDISDNELTNISPSITKHNYGTFDISKNQLTIQTLPGYLISWLDENDSDWRITQKSL